MRSDSAPAAVRLVQGVLGLVLAVYTAELALDVLPSGITVLFQKFAANAVFLGAAAVCGWRAIAVRKERLAWALLATGLLSWGLGNFYFTLALWDLEKIPFPSPADAGYLLLYPPVYAGIVLLFRARVSRAARAVWVDGIAGALAVAAVATSVLFGAVIAGTGGSAATVATNLAYPLGDLLLLAMVVGALAVGGWKLHSAWSWIAAGLLIFAVSDGLYLYGNANGTYEPGAVLDAGWPTLALFVAIAAWWPDSGRHGRRDTGLGVVALPVAFGLAGLGVLVHDHFVPTTELALVLAAAAVLAVFVRLIMTFAENLRMLQSAASEAQTDALTGMGNRRRLMDDLRDAHDGRDGDEWILTIYDLDGFKQYNDLFGHPAGDALLERLGRKVAAALPQGARCYRMGGDEFCTLVPFGSRRDAPPAVVRALSEQGPGFTVTASHGSVLMPREAQTPEEALRLADQRMYEHKNGGRLSPGRQTTAVLLQAMAETHPGLERHSGDVVRLAEETGRVLGVEGQELEDLRLSAELHDIGKLALPRAILDKPKPLDPSEWAFVRRHTIIGERIIGAAPALRPVARAVRSSHERMDGRGYPDGLAGDDIPLLARIVAVCDAYDAITSDRAYRDGRSPQEAVAELRRCSGMQFDPLVVEALETALSAALHR